MTQNIARLVTRNVKPIWAHDCTNCRFVGCYQDADLYVCIQPTVVSDLDESVSVYVARHGGAPGAYRSMGNFSAKGTIYNLIRILALRPVGVTHAYM